MARLTLALPALLVLAACGSGDGGKGGAAAEPVAVGDAWSWSLSNSLALEMLQFWQNLHVRLQPAVPKLRIGVPGRKWLSGFFSMGSMQKPDERP